jgi:hypothetical protein
MAKNRGILAGLKDASCKDMLTVLQSVDQQLLESAISGSKFEQLFFENATESGIVEYLRSL